MGTDKMKLLYGTGNPAKMTSMRKRLKNLARQYGGLTAVYKNAICLVIDDEHIYEAMEPSMESSKFLITDKPYSNVKKKGFPLDSLSVDIKTGQYFYELSYDKQNSENGEGAEEAADAEDGFVEFFRNILHTVS